MLRFSPLLLPWASRGSSTSRGGEARRQPARTSCIPETVRLHSRLALLALIHLSAWNVHSRKLYRLGGYRDGSLEVVVIVELVEVNSATSSRGMRHPFGMRSIPR